MIKPVGSPACFAAASIFNLDSNVCEKCMAFTECGVASAETLEKIKHLINVDDLMRRHEAARKAGLIRLAASDAKIAAETPPGNGLIPLPLVPIVRKTAVVKIKFDPTGEEVDVIAKMSKTVQKMATVMVKSNQIEDVKTALKAGVNFYAEQGYEWMRVAIDMLMNEGGFTRSTLRQRLEKDLSWSNATAAAYVGYVVTITVAFKITCEKKGHISLIPTISK